MSKNASMKQIKRQFSFLIFLVVLCLGACSSDGLQTPNAVPDTLLMVTDVTAQDHFKLLVDESFIEVLTIKDDDVPVRSTFNFASGWLKKNGEARVRVDLASWNSGLALRDGRMRKIFFAVQKPENRFVDFKLTKWPQSYEAKRPQKEFMIEGLLTFRGKSYPLSGKFASQPVSEFEVEAKSLEPITLRINELGLSQNLKTLMRVCGHKSIDQDVKLSFFLKFVGVKSGPQS